MSKCKVGWFFFEFHTFVLHIIHILAIHSLSFVQVFFDGSGDQIKMIFPTVFFTSPRCWISTKFQRPQPTAIHTTLPLGVQRGPCEALSALLEGGQPGSGVFFFKDKHANWGPVLELGQCPPSRAQEPAPNMLWTMREWYQKRGQTVVVIHNPMVSKSYFRSRCVIIYSTDQHSTKIRKSKIRSIEFKLRTTTSNF